MPLFATKTPARPGRGPLLAGVAALAALAVANHFLTRRAERRHPPEGAFVEVDGVRLHYSDRGTGSPVVLIHGNAVTGDDWNTSGLAQRLLPHHRVIIFDRPGYGYSDRPRGRLWTASEQADLIHAALRRLGVVRPVVVGHSWGTLPAVALAVRHQADVAGLVLLSGYYFWTLRPDVLLVAAGALPVIGDLLSHTLSPLLGWLQMPLLKWAMFSPTPVPSRFQAEYSSAMTLRPSQIRAMSMDGVLMIPGAIGLRRHYRNLDLPVAILAGVGDRVVFRRRAEGLQQEIRGSTLQILPEVGHMVHYAAPGEVAQAIERVAAAATVPSPDQDRGGAGPAPRELVDAS
ncbi:Alpha/beta hydrolase [Rhodovastum atsumiense]|uniref:Alpha/beta hydrolase n=1 Tax=Rhodovastum atsumiense TaxID=504468 RepID=A0A5M6IVF6_9PROT|nr:alpha/beta hydrolase [Rhodovastum atsumiense]KAA5611395.1 alpha/beta hydrolase [Rhodovastum atsumiense]CAH2603594.1 Alpha/beta hydrolase [Rhodovastum atsumiense]